MHEHQRRLQGYRITSYNVCYTKLLRIIRDANVTIEVDHGKFEVAKGRIESLITAIGFIQESNIRKDPIYNGDEKQYVVRGYITVRIRADRFESFLSDISGT